MHDAFGRELNVGDRVMIPATIKSVTLDENYCNLTVELEASMPPYSHRDSQTVNAKQVLRNTEGDSLDYTVFWPVGMPRQIIPAPTLPVVVKLPPRTPCDKYTRPDGVMGGPCLTCGLTQPEHVGALVQGA